MMYCVYKHTSPNGKVYIGITCQNPLKRWNGGRGYMNNLHFWNAIVKYGWDNFKHEILFDGLSKEEACEKEIELIAEHKSNEFEHGYNRSTGGENAGAGVQKSEETRNKISVSLSGRKMPQDRIAKSAAAHRGLKRSEETKAKMRESAKLRGVPEKTRKKTRTQVICVQTGKIYPSINEAAKDTGISRTVIGNCCTGYTRKSRSYDWRYYEKSIKQNERED